ncbi:hypothetical protein ACJXWG_004576 [Vibrio parahaemolyticus]|nr:hypothetical protein [Vibrio vulnificus]
MFKEPIKSSFATVQIGVAKADGKLSLTDTEVVFVPFNEQLGLGPYHIKRDEIKSVIQDVGKGGGIIPIITDAIRITLSNDSTFVFITANPKQWVEIFSEITS